ncbi:MAG: helix-turn-helix transcriptional regulator [Clostridia bacterium]|nr:helix-turn-helix transcriptional regulator [Clostridia bacterium]
MKIFQERLKELRKEKGLLQKDLAQTLKTTNSSISDWEKGRSQPDLQTLANLARFFEVSVDYLLGLED